MLSSHAILHVTSRWRAGAIEAMTHAIVNLGIAPDTGLAMRQGDFRIYAPRQPYFYEGTIHSHHLAAQQPRVTLDPLPLLEVGSISRISTGTGTMEVRVVREEEAPANLARRPRSRGRNDRTHRTGAQGAIGGDTPPTFECKRLPSVSLSELRAMSKAEFAGCQLV